MTVIQHTLKRPQRWETPLDAAMSAEAVESLLSVAPFARMDAAKFPESLPLRGILQNDARLVRLQEGDVVLREGDYGNSAFLVLSGSVRVILKNLPRHLLGRSSQRKVGWLASLTQGWLTPAYPEVRRYGKAGGGGQGDAVKSRIFLQDIPGVLDENATARLTAGQVFGELAALTRTPRSASVIADGPVELLEIRWQGLRDLLRYDAAWREHIDRLYRENSLRVHLRETPLLAGLSPEALHEVAEATQFETFGNFDWNHKFQKTAQADSREQMQAEPLIAEQGDYPSGLLLIRNGFARLSERCDSGERTLAYLGKGEYFGLSVLADNWNRDDARGWDASLRAIGYVDVLRIPVPIVEKWILPTLPSEEISRLRESLRRTDENRLAATRSKSMEKPASGIETGLLEFLVEKRYVNGTQAMVIDLDRCTRCDDCVRACASTHDNNPRFNREGIKYDRFLFAHACMHCVDPVCMIGCPTGAIHRDTETGNVVINDDTCIGCTTCANSCPYSNIQMVEIRNDAGEPFRDAQTQLPIAKATKCDLCTGRPGGPACVRACPHDALVRLDLHTIALPSTASVGKGASA